jgi:NAD(P)-dependent dehydrogenase (short-subunit alcohol dehydrogenase family)
MPLRPEADDTPGGRWQHDDVPTQPNRSAIVTGASRGLGLALARSLAMSGWALAIDARSGIQDAGLLLGAEGAASVATIAGDVTDPDHAAALVAAARSQGPLHLLVHNASTLGASPQPRLSELDPAVLTGILEVNLVAPLRLTQLALPDLRRNGGRVISITSDAAVEGYEGWGGYGASKAALEQMSNVLAAEEPEVRVYWVDPGDMRTTMHQDAFPGEDISDRPLPETRVPGFAQLVEGSLPSGRYRIDDLLGAQ